MTVSSAVRGAGGSYLRCRTFADLSAGSTGGSRTISVASGYDAAILALRESIDTMDKSKGGILRGDLACFAGSMRGEPWQLAQTIGDQLDASRARSTTRAQ